MNANVPEREHEYEHEREREHKYECEWPSSASVHSIPNRVHVLEQWHWAHPYLVYYHYTNLQFVCACICLCMSESRREITGRRSAHTKNFPFSGSLELAH